MEHHKSYILPPRVAGMIDPFDHSKYVFYKYAGAVEVSDGYGNSILYAVREGINKLGKPIHVYTNKYRTEELLTISSPKGRKELFYDLGDHGSLLFDLLFFMIHPCIEYRVTDAVTGEIVGSVVQKSRQIITKDEWVLISGGKIVGRLKSVRYFLHGMIWPRRYEIVAQDGRVVGKFRQHRNVSNFKYTMEITDQCIDTRLLVAAGIVIVTLKASF